MTREEQIEKASIEYSKKIYIGSVNKNLAFQDFNSGAKWADENPIIMNKTVALSDEEIDLVFENVELKSKLDIAITALTEILEFHFYGHHAQKFKKILKELNDSRY